MNKSALPLALLLAACGAAGAPDPSATAASDPATEIASMLQASADAWNSGDLDSFLDDYMDAETTTFTGATGTVRGTDEIRRRYQAGYFGTGRPLHALRFEDIEVRPLGDDHALALGRFILTEPGDGSVASSGMFTLVLARTDHGWKIIHDHSSAAQ